MSEAPRHLQDDLARLRQRVEVAAAGLDHALREAVSAEPLLAVVAASGLGFVLGGGVSRGTAALLLGAGVRLVGAWVEQGGIERARAREDTT